MTDKPWISVTECPACGRTATVSSEELPLHAYRFADEVISVPPEGIRIIECGGCGLFYKDVLPSPEFLAEVFTNQAGKVWADNYDFTNEVSVIDRLRQGRAFDVLDLGASNGGLLKALACNESGGRRSALDVVAHPGLEPQISGEFVHGLADSVELHWSLEPYDLITMFDVAEHLYDPSQAFSNLRDFLRPRGFVVLETGDAESFWPQAFGVHHWWYACLFEHHILWSARSLQYIADQQGFRILDFHKKRHKFTSSISLRRYPWLVSKGTAYRLSPAWYRSLAKVTNKNGLQPWTPFAKDHFHAVLQRKD